MEDFALSDAHQKSGVFEALQYRWSARTLIGNTSNCNVYSSVDVNGDTTAVKEIRVRDMREADCVMQEVHLLRAAQVCFRSQVPA